jgi:hypothetical protein
MCSLTCRSCMSGHWTQDRLLTLKVLQKSANFSKSKSEVNFALEKTKKVHRGNRGIALFYFESQRYIGVGC